MKDIKVKSEIFAGHPIWGIYKDEKRLDFYWRKTKKQEEGITKEQLLNIIKTKDS